MFRLLIFFVIILFVILLIVAIANILKTMSLKKREENYTSSMTDDIEYLIERIRLKIIKAETDAASGIEGAEKEIQYWKEELEKTKKLKERTKNL